MILLVPKVRRPKNGIADSESSDGCPRCWLRDVGFTICRCRTVRAGLCVALSSAASMSSRSSTSERRSASIRARAWPRLRHNPVARDAISGATGRAGWMRSQLKGMDMASRASHAAASDARAARQPVPLGNRAMSRLLDPRSLESALGGGRTFTGAATYERERSRRPLGKRTQLGACASGRGGCGVASPGLV
jgi:hypothetical protein